VLQLDDPAAPELRVGELRVTVRTQAKRIPEAERRASTQLLGEVRSSPQGRVRVQGPVAPSAASEAVLEPHAHDRHHSQAAIVDLSQQALLLLGHVGNGFASRQAEGAIALVITGVLPRWRLQVEDLDGANEGQDLQDTQTRDLGRGGEAIREICELHTLAGGAEAGPPEVLRHDVAQARKHRHTAVLQLDDPAAPELRVGELRVTVRTQAKRIPEAERRASTQLLGEIRSSAAHGARRGRGPGSRAADASGRGASHGQGTGPGQRGRGGGRCGGGRLRRGIG